ncbi:LytTR family transcriptional regulator DNA-binding domain-containing protein [Paenibacillus marinisediminis]
MSTLELQQVSKMTGNSTLLPLIELKVDAGQCVVIQCNHELGHRLIEAIIGNIPISTGQILFEGQQLTKESFDVIKKQIGIQMLTDNAYERLTVLQYITFFTQLYESKADVIDIVGKIGLTDRQHTKVSKLSYSEVRRLMIGRAIVHHPKLLILEEPEQNVDIETSYIIRTLLQTLKDEGMSILVTTTVLEQALTLTNEVYLYGMNGLKKVDTAEEEQERVSAVEPSTPNEESATDSSPHEEAATSVPQAVQTQETLRPVRMEKIPAKVSDKIILFDPTEIDYIESQEGVSNLHVHQSTYPCALTLNELEAKLKAFGFFRCHRSYLVNLQKVREVITWTRNSFSLILDDAKKSTIPLSKGKYDELKQILGF